MHQPKFYYAIIVATNLSPHDKILPSY